jgi:hypothetical protein
MTKRSRENNHGNAIEKKKHTKKRSKYLPMKKTLTNVKNEAQKDDPS